MSTDSGTWLAPALRRMGLVGPTEPVEAVALAQPEVGSFARSERLAKWNEALRIEEALGGKARFAGWRVPGR